MHAWTIEELPAPTSDVEQAKRDITEFGYCIIREAITAERAAEVRQRLAEQAQAEREQGLKRLSQVQDDQGINQWIPTLINKGAVLVELLANPLVVPVAEHLLGPEPLLSDFAAHLVHPGASSLPLHIDQWWMPQPRRPGEHYVQVGAIDRSNIAPGDPAPTDQPINPPCVVNAFWMISDFTDANGGTRIVPRSHLSGAQPDTRVPHSVETISIAGSAGSAVVWDGRTWHAAGANTGNDTRYGITMYFGGPQFRSLTNHTLATHREIVAGASPELRTLLGFKSWNEYGRTGQSEDGYELPAERLTGALKP